MIAETDLILKNGNIYHINVNKDDVAKTIILVGDPGRVEMVSKYFDTIRHKSQHREFVIHTGTLQGLDLSVVSTGIGPDNIDIVINELDAIFNVDLETREIKKELTSLNLIRLGTCGTIQEDIPVNSIIVSKYGLALDNLLNYYDDYKIDKIYLQSLSEYKQIIECDLGLFELFKEQISGVTITAPGFYAPQGRLLRLTNHRVPKLIEELRIREYRNSRFANFEMETSALYGLSKLSGHKAITLCTVVANRITKDFTKNAEEAVDNMIKYCLNKITTLPDTI